MWQEFVVRIDEREVFAGARAQSGVAGGGDALILLSDQLQSRFAGVARSDQAGGVVGRAVVHDQQFPVLQSLVPHAFNGAPDRIGPVIGWQNNGYEWHKRVGPQDLYISLSCLPESMNLVVEIVRQI